MVAWRSHGRRLFAGLKVAAATLGLTVLFVGGTTLGLVGHLNLAAGRRATASFLDGTLADLFQGRVSIGSLAKVSPDEIVAEDVVVRDEAARIVLKVTRLTAQADVIDVLTRIVRGDEKLTIVINHVRVERAEANIVPAEDGIPTLAHAFTPKPSATEEDAATPERYVRVWLPAIELGQGFARGSLEGSPTIEAEISGAHASVLATPKGAAIDVSRFSLLARGLGGADAKGVASLHIRAPGAMWSSFDGYIGDVQFGSVARWEKQALDVKLDLPRAEPAAARALLAQWPLLVPAEARVHVKGKPPDLDVDVSAKLGDQATLASSGTLHAASPLRLQLDVEGRQLDLRALWAQAPRTSIDLDTDLGVRDEHGHIVVDVGGGVQPTTIGTFAIPAIDFSGSTGEGGFNGEAKLHDRGLPLDLGFSVFPDGKIEVDAEAKRVNLAKVERIKPYFDGDGTADMRVRATLDHGRLDTSLSMDVRGLSYQGLVLSSARLTAGAKGSLDKPGQIALDARVAGKQLKAGRFAFADVSASARGPLASPTVTTSLKDPNGPNVDARAIVAVGTPVSVRKLTLGVSRDNVEIRGDVAQLDLSKDRVLIRALQVHGASGELSGNAEITPTSFSATAQGQNLDLSAFSRILGLPRGSLEGRASIAIDALASGKTERGTVELSVSKASVANVGGISGQLSAKLDGHRLSGASTGNVESVASFSADFDTQLDGPVTERASFERAIGDVTVGLTKLNLSTLGQLIPRDDLSVAGQANVTLKATRQDPAAVPSLSASAQTNGLMLNVSRSQQPPLVVSGIELMASASHDGSSGVTTIALGATQGSERLVSSSTELELDLKAAFSGQEALGAQLRNHPIASKIVVNRLDLDNLPGQLRVPGLRGAVRVEGTLRGSLAAPVASLGVRATDLRFARGERGELVDVCGNAEYAKEGGAFSIGAEVFLPAGFELARTPCNGRRIAAVQLRGQAPFDFEHGMPQWSGTASATMESFPLSVVPQLADARMTGTTSGTVVLDRSGQEPRASAQLQLAALKVDQLEVGDGSLKLRSDASQARVDFEVRRGATSIAGNASAGVSWASQLPQLDDAAPIDVGLNAHQLEVSVLEPVLADFVSELHGNADANLSARLAPLGADETTRHIEQVSGDVSLTDGSLVLNGLGFRLRQVGLSAHATRDGKTTLVDIPNLVATAGNSKPGNLTAHVILRLAGFDIVSGSGSFGIEGVPLVVDGVTRATAKATVTNLKITRDEARVLVEVPFDELLIQLPEEDSRQLIDLKENSRITLLQPITQPQTEGNQGSLPWQFAIQLGNKAKITRGAQLDVPIAGDPNVVLGEAVGVTGSILLPRRGSVQLLGRLFQIESGAIVFDTPDPKDPRLDVRASWHSNATNDTLFMYISGTVSKPKVQFDRSESEAIALLAGTTQRGVGEASIGMAALDSLLADTPLSRVQLRGKDSGETGKGTIYTAAYRASDRVVVEGNYQAVQNTGDAQAAAGVGAAVDYRMTKTVSVRAQLGTIGTGVDLVYQYRY